MDASDIDAFFQHYLVCALWSSNDNRTPSGGEPLDKRYDPDDFHPHCAAGLRAECVAFVEANLADLANLSAEQAGHDFWLTRCGHGAGFWDRGLGDVGKRLTDACKPYGNVDLYDYRGKVYAFGYEPPRRVRR